MVLLYLESLRKSGHRSVLLVAHSVKGAVSRDSAKLRNYKMPVKLRETKIIAYNFKGRLK